MPAKKCTVPLLTDIPLADAEKPVTSPMSSEERTEPPVLNVGELRLRPLRFGDEHELMLYLTDPVVREHTSIPVPTLQAVTAAVERDIAAYANRSSFRFALATPDDRLIGVCGFNTWSTIHRHAELAYELSPQYWGRGYMQQAVLALLRWGFSELSLNRVHAFVMTSNARSIRLLERCGFIQEGTLREFRIAGGEPRDFHVYSVLAHEVASTDHGACWKAESADEKSGYRERTSSHHHHTSEVP